MGKGRDSGPGAKAKVAKTLIRLLGSSLAFSVGQWAGRSIRRLILCRKFHGMESFVSSTAITAGSARAYECLQPDSTLASDSLLGRLPNELHHANCHACQPVLA